MEEALKKRLVGAVTMVALAVIFIPPLIERPVHEPIQISAMPPVPDDLRRMSAEAWSYQPPVAPQIPEYIRYPANAADAPSEPLVSLASGQGESIGTPLTTDAEDDSSASVVEHHPNLSSWVIQAASFVKRENALKLVKRLRRAGFQTPDPERVSVQGQPHYRVKVGPMLEKSRAKKLLPKINSLSGSQGRVVLHRP